MAEIANTLWYRLGTISATDGSTKVTGVGTHFTTAGINPGATLRVDGRFYAYEVKRVVSDTELELATPYYGGNISSASYSIDRNFQSTTNAKLAADVTDLVGLYEQVRDGTMLTIEGKSAYQIAVANGFKGTESEWLESLKAAGEITTINTKLSRIYTNNAAAHNAVPRSKYLGTSITAAQIQAIRNGSFEDLYIGDYWSLPIDGNTIATIVAFGITPQVYTGIPSKPNLCLWFNNISQNWVCPINDTATCVGHLKGSKIYTQTMPEILAKIKTIIPAEYIETRKDYIYDSINSSGVPNHYVEEDMQIYLPSSWNFNQKNHGYSGIIYSSQITWPYSLYRTQNEWINCWLCENYNATDWCNRAPQGNNFSHSAANHNQWISCAPYILLA